MGVNQLVHFYGYFMYMVGSVVLQKWCRNFYCTILDVPGLPVSSTNFHVPSFCFCQMDT